VYRALCPADVRRPARLTAGTLRPAVTLTLALALPSLALGATGASTLEVRVLPGAGPAPAAAEVTRGALDKSFVAPASPASLPQLSGTHWVRLQAIRSLPGSAMPVIAVAANRYVHVAVYRQGRTRERLDRVAALPQFGGTREAAFRVPDEGLRAGQVLYARLQADAATRDPIHFQATTLQEMLARGARHALTISLACGALVALALTAAAMWFVLGDELFILYAGMTALLALYLAYFSGQAFRWPGFGAGRAFAPYAWNVPVALSGAMACLFAREIADLRHTSARIYQSFGWLATAFAVLAVANAGRLIGLGSLVAAVGNLMFVGGGAFVLVVAFLSWRRGNRAAGWFLCAWVLLETFSIVSSGRLLFSRAASNEALFYYGLPGSMVASAILTSLGVADRLRQQRFALTEAERRARTDPLTGVLNRRSLLEQLEAACRHARANGLPVSVLFLDLDFFKSINDSYGHAAGDTCLAAVIRPIQAELRQSDIIGRYGGEEFVVVLGGADAAAAEPIAERIRQRVSETLIEGHRARIQLTCSIGVASSHPDGVWGEALVAQADMAVYAAKRLGRNRVQVATALAA
jgi:diguanylate cyclase (GGDEF)-like protein